MTAMRGSLRGILLCVLAGVASAVAGTAALAGGSPEEQGQQILEANCSRCHAIGPTGESKHPQAPPFRVVVTRYEPSSLAEALAEGIVSGHPDMPVFVFQPDEIQAIVAYLDTLKKR